MSDAVARLAAELNVRVFQGCTDKEAGLRQVSEELHLTLDSFAYIGDDLDDLPALQQVGLPIAVADAVPEVIEVAGYITKNPGGHGAVREVVEYLLRGQGRWDAAVQTYLEHIRNRERLVRMPRSEE
ncbi:MAG: KdsC family phosphatase [Armatimonadota bacterium]